MYVNAHLSENAVLVYTDDLCASDTALRTYYCLDCSLEFTSADAESCPGCGSDEVQRVR